MCEVEFSLSLEYEFRLEVWNERMRLGGGVSVAMKEVWEGGDAELLLSRGILAEIRRRSFLMGEFWKEKEEGEREILEGFGRVKGRGRSDGAVRLKKASRPITYDSLEGYFIFKLTN